MNLTTESNLGLFREILGDYNERVHHDLMLDFYEPSVRFNFVQNEICNILEALYDLHTQTYLDLDDEQWLEDKVKEYQLDLDYMPPIYESFCKLSS